MVNILVPDFTRDRRTFIAPDWVHDGVNDAISYTEDVQKRRKLWLEFAEDNSMDEKGVNITNEGIEIEGVGMFELFDTELTNGHWKEDLGAPTLEEFRGLFNFLYQRIGDKNSNFFLNEIMMMKGERYWTSTGGKGFDGEKAWAFLIPGENYYSIEQIYKEPSENVQGKYPRSLRRKVN